MNIFNDYAYYYDLFYKDKKYDEEVEYVEKIIKKYFNKAKSILDFGCGTGIHAAYFSQKGYLVHGIDISKKMVEQAIIKNKKLSKELSFSCDDIRFARLDKKYDVILSLFHVISYQISNQDLNNVFLTAKENINKNGLFIFDCWYGPAVLNDRPVVRVKRFDTKKDFVTKMCEPMININQNYVDIKYQINVQNKETKMSKEFKEVHKMRYLFRPEIEFLLNESGFDLIGFEEWLKGDVPTDESWNVSTL